MAQTFLAMEFNLSVTKNFAATFYEKFTGILLTCFTIFPNGAPCFLLLFPLFFLPNFHSPILN
jgi:hypothetical protein